MRKRLLAIVAAIYFAHTNAATLFACIDRFQGAGFMKTAVPGIYAIPGGEWDAVGGSLGYYVPQGMGLPGRRQVDTSHVSQSLAHRIKCLDPDLRIPWGFLVDDENGVTLIDISYHSEDLVERIKKVAPGKALRIIFTHSDFLGVAETDNWRKSFETVRILAHEADAMGKGGIEKLGGHGPWNVGNFQIHAAPGHTEGSLIVSSNSRNTTFGGDSAGVWQGKFTGFPEMARFSCKAQSMSLRGFADHAPFYKYWFPGHGLPTQFKSPAERKKLLYQVADDLEQASQSGEVSAP